jgi:hypothetical protein
LLVGIQQSKIFSVIMFWGDCEFRTQMPANVLTAGYTDYIRSKRLLLFDDIEVRRIVATIRQRMLPRTWASGQEHIAQLTERFGSTTTCAKCGSPLALRTARSGSNAGGQFYGCTRYPVCRYVRRISDVSDR